ncbi:MAG: DUF4384 domain-containing protein [Treponema sp.]|nr:DUF4384 domain-containing protein [Treponema sp.]
MKNPGLFLLSCYGVIAVSFLFAQAEKTGDEGFEWSVGILNQKRKSEIALNRPVRMETGDVFSFRLKSGAGCFAYVVAQHSDGSAAFYRGVLEAGKTVDAGPFDISGPGGAETFYIIACAAEQTALDAAIAAYKTAPDPDQAARGVANEIFKLRRAVSRLNEKPEKQVSLGDGVRGLEFSGADAYVKTVTVEH